MKLTGLSITALVLLLSGPAFAAGHCGDMDTDADGDCVEMTEEVTPVTETVPDEDNVGETVEVEVEPETEAEPDPDEEEAEEEAEEVSTD